MPAEFERILIERKILNYQEAIQGVHMSKEKDLRVILASGTFDVVHLGHIDYLRSAKLAGDLLFVGVENDECVCLNKGNKRPANRLCDRLKLLSELQLVDFVFGYTDVAIYGKTPEIYVQRYKELNPNLVAVNKFDPHLDFKRTIAKEAGVELLIINSEKRDSTSRLLEIIGYE